MVSKESHNSYSRLLCPRTAKEVSIPLVGSWLYDCVQRLELASSEAESVDLVFFPVPQLPLELLNQPSNGCASYQACLESACTHPLPSSKGHCFVQIHWIIFLIKKPLWLPFLRAFPVFLVHVACINVHGNLKTKKQNIIGRHHIKLHLGEGSSLTSLPAGTKNPPNWVSS